MPMILPMDDNAFLENGRRKTFAIWDSMWRAADLFKQWRALPVDSYAFPPQGRKSWISLMDPTDFLRCTGYDTAGVIGAADGWDIIIAMMKFIHLKMADARIGTLSDKNCFRKDIWRQDTDGRRHSWCLQKGWFIRIDGHHPDAGRILPFLLHWRYSYAAMNKEEIHY